MRQKKSSLAYRILLCILILFGKSAVFAQTNMYPFRTLTSDQGLIHNHINCALRDQYNYLWFGTESGLSRFDGMQFTNFRYSGNKEQGLSSNVISGLFEGPEGDVWIRTSNKMNIFDQRTGTIIQRVDSVLAGRGLPAKDVYTIRPLGSGKFALLYADRSLVVYDAAKGNFRSISPWYQQSRISDVIRGREQSIWIIYEDGLLSRTDLRSLQSHKVAQLALAHKQVNLNIFEDRDGDLWVYAKDKPVGAYWLHPQTGRVRHLQSELSNPFVGNVVEDTQGLIWLGTDHGGINAFNKQNGKIEIIRNDRYDLRSLPYNSITALYRDQSGIIWVGTYKGGISYYHPNLLLFPLIKNYPGLPRSLPFDDVNKFVEDRKGNLWIGTNGGGLLYYDISKKTFTQYMHHPGQANSLSSNVIVSLHLDRDGLLWIGTYRGGLCSFDGKNFRTFVRGAGAGQLNDDSVWEVYEDSSGRFWVGTLGGGLYLFDRKTEVFSKAINQRRDTLTSNYISVLFEDSKKQLWIGTATGMARLGSDGQIKYFNTNSSPRLSNNLIYDIKEDRRGRIWAATQDGLHVIEDGHISYLTQKDGLSDDALLALLVDNKGNLWASSNKGLSEIVASGDPGKFIVRNFKQELGLQGNVFNENAALKLRDGRLVFGGPKGFNFIDPEAIVSEQGMPTPVLSNIYLFNKRVAVGEAFAGRVIYDQSLHNLKELKLPYNLNALSLELSTFDYLQQNSGLYQYQLIGLSDEWFDFEPGTLRANFTNLDAKAYRFYIRHALDTHHWSEKVLLLTIDIQPPFWRSTWAFALYAGVLFSLLWIFYYLTKLRARTRNQLYLAKEQALQAKELDALKTRFFTNVSHEFRTPISLILTPTQQLLSQEEDEHKKADLSLIKKNADRLLKLVNQLLDFRKLERSQLELRAEYGDIMGFIHEQVQAFSALAETSQVRLDLDLVPSSFSTWFDKNKLESIVFNLVSNAIKFSPTMGTVCVQAGIGGTNLGKSVYIEVKNQGVPIPDRLQQRIFERYFQLEVPNGKLNQGTGIGLSIVKEYVEFLNGKIEVSSDSDWTRFYVELPIQAAEPEVEQKPNLPAGNPRILLVEDDADFLHYMERCLRPNYVIIRSQTVGLAKEHLSRQPIDLIIADLNLPGESGLDLCRYVRGQGKLDHIPVLIVTAVVNQRTEVEALRAGATDYIHKPFHIELLQSKLAQILGQQQNLVRRYQKQIKVDLVQPEIESADEQFIRALITEIEKDLSDSALSVELLAKRMNITRVGLYKKVLAITGYSPTEYVRHIRLKRAMHLVQNSKLSIAEIAYAVGFGNPKQFSKYFKSAFGNLPSYYRK